MADTEELVDMEAMELDTADTVWATEDMVTAIPLITPMAMETSMVTTLTPASTKSSATAPIERLEDMQMVVMELDLMALHWATEKQN